MSKPLLMGFVAGILILAAILSLRFAPAPRRTPAQAPSATPSVLRAAPAAASPHADAPAAQASPTTGTASPSTAPRRVTGKVLGADGELCSASVVALSNEDPFGRRLVTSSGADGAFEMTLLPGQWWLHAEGDGTVSAPCDMEIEVEDGYAYDRSVLWLEEVGTVRGCVYDPDGRPCPGARVTSLGAPTWGDGMSSSTLAPDPAPCLTVQADDRGRFEIPFVPGEPGLQAEVNGYPPACQSVEIKAGQTVEADIHLARATQVEGAVVDTRGQPLSDVLIEIHLGMSDPPFPRTRTTHTDGRGVYRMAGLSVDEYYDVYASLKGYLRAWEHFDGEKPTAVDLVLVRAAAIEGRVRSLSGAAPPEGTTVALRPPTESKGAFAPHIRGDRHEMRLYKADGTFRMDKVPPGRYFVQARAEGTAISESEEIEVPEGSLIQGVVITLLAGGVFRGTVRAAGTGKPLVYVPIGEILEGPETGSYPWHSETGGRFQVNDLSAGPHRFRFFGTGCASREVTVDVPEGGVVEQDVVLGEGARIHGRVLLDGAPAKGVSVSVASGSATCPSIGSYEWLGAAPGSQYVSVFLGRGKDQTAIRCAQLVHVEGENPLQVDFELRTTPVVSGTARRGGLPLARKYVAFVGTGSNDGCLFHTVTDDQGNFVFLGMPSGDSFLVDEELGKLALDPATGELHPDTVHAPLVRIDGHANQAHLDVDLPAAR